MVSILESDVIFNHTGFKYRLLILDHLGENSSGEEERVDGTAAKVEYFRATDKLIMHGSATLTRKDSTLTSEEIEYDVDTDRYSAGGAGGINIQFTTDDD